MKLLERTSRARGASREKRGFPLRSHDHAVCVEAALAAAAAVCAQRGARLTPTRRRVLELVWLGHRPVGAYEVLAGLAPDRSPGLGHGGHPGVALGPPTVYRALDFLLAQGLVHRIESLSAYIGCSAPGHGPAPQILVCEDCGAAAEIADGSADAAARASAARLGFVVGSQIVEAVGRCADCGTSESGDRR
jgi:Fur family zinc uptake transcriptional regulator